MSSCGGPRDSRHGRFGRRAGEGVLDCEKYVLESDHYQVEVMANLDKLPSTGGVIFVDLPKFDKFPGFPACAWAVVPNED